MFGGGYGQNLAAYGTSDTGLLDLPSLAEWSITEEWYNSEIGFVPWGQDSPSTSGPEFLHATQVIWKASTQVGCSTVQCAAGTIFGMTSWYTGKFSVLHNSTDLTDRESLQLWAGRQRHGRVQLWDQPGPRPRHSRCDDLIGLRLSFGPKVPP